MASTVQTGGGSGVDLSELTSGELLFCSLLKTGYIHLGRGGQSGRTYVYFGHAFESGAKKGTDMSKISQISFTGTTSGDGSVQWKNESTSTYANFSANNSFSISAPSGDNSHCEFTINFTNSTYCTIKVTSFTTTDGKVHTADNLNY